MNIVILPLSVTSSWGNGHATNYRALARALHARGHEVTFLERDMPWYASARDVNVVEYASIHLYSSVADLQDRFYEQIRSADLTIVGSYVPDGVPVSHWVTEVSAGVTAFYDIDTPVTLDKLRSGDFEYIDPESIPLFDLYLSFTGGPTLDVLEHEFGARSARAFYCIFDPEEYRPSEVKTRWDLGYLGTYSPDRHPPLEELMIGPARRAANRRFCVAGPGHLDDRWPQNVERIDHLPPAQHPDFYCAQRFTLNVTRSQMIAAGYSPSVRLFEAAACGVPIISDRWPGIDDVFTPGEEILLVEKGSEVLEILNDMTDDERRALGVAARQRVLQDHTADRRVEQLEAYLAERRGAPDVTTG